MRDLLGNGIFNVDGAAWKSQRRLASHVFNVKNFKEFVNVVFKVRTMDHNSCISPDLI